MLLEQQDRSRWNQEVIREGLTLLESALGDGACGSYALQAAIAGLHARAEKATETDWAQIVAIYDLLVKLQPTPVVELNRAAAVAMARGTENGLRALDALRFKLAHNHLFHAARAELLMRLGRMADAARDYRAALTTVTNPAEKRFIEGRLSECTRK